MNIHSSLLTKVLRSLGRHLSATVYIGNKRQEDVSFKADFVGTTKVDLFLGKIIFTTIKIFAQFSNEHV